MAKAKLGLKNLGPSTWTSSRVVNKNRATVPGLTSGQRAWFRVAAGQGPASDPATKIVP